MLDTSLTDFDALTEPDYIDGSTTEFSSRSVFGRVTYTYDSRYLFEANVRYDGSSRFSPEKPMGIFSFRFNRLENLGREIHEEAELARQPETTCFLGTTRK